MRTNFNACLFNNDVSFFDSIFNKDVTFRKANFKANADFTKVISGSNVNFSHANFISYLSFQGKENEATFRDEAYLNLQHISLEKPERVSFHTLRLHPYWFINVDTRKFSYTNIEWINSHSLKLEVEYLRPHIESSPHRFLSITYRPLAVNEEENHRYDIASEFRFKSFDVQRIKEFSSFVPWKLSWWYWLASGYGEARGRHFLSCSH